MAPPFAMSSRAASSNPVSSMRSAVLLERRRLAAAHHDVEAIAERVERHRRFPIEQRNQPIARAFVGSAIEDRIVCHQWIAREIHLRDQARRERGTKYRKVNVRSAPGVVVVLPWICARLDGDE